LPETKVILRSGVGSNNQAFSRDVVANLKEVSEKPVKTNRSILMVSFDFARRRFTVFGDYVLRLAPSEFLGHISFVREMRKRGVTLNTVLDIGAHSGRWTKWISKALGRGAEFHLVEPQTKFGERLAKLGKYYPLILSNEPREVAFYSIGGTGDSYLREVTSHYQGLEPTKQDAVPLHSVRGIPKRVDLVKVDTQGSELDILRGFGETLKSVKLVILEVPLFVYNFGAPSFSEYLDFMEENGFFPWRILNEHRTENRLMQVDIGFVSFETLESLTHQRGSN
jgi:FkbM family methyltransferase